MQGLCVGADWMLGMWWIRTVAARLLVHCLRPEKINKIELIELMNSGKTLYHLDSRDMDKKDFFQGIVLPCPPRSLSSFNTTGSNGQTF